jgi:hypothetical protein
VRAAAVAAGYRSAFEQKIGTQLAAAGPEVLAHYEEIRLRYTTEHTYTPDWRVRVRSGRSFFVEAKGLFTAEDRTKLQTVRDQNPGVDIRLVFQRAATKIRKGSKTSYGQWATNAGFKWAEGAVPQAWLDE